MTWHEYHRATMHSAESLRRSPHFLDWANMPGPFRHYDGVPVLDLPADPPVPPGAVRDGAEFLSQLLFYSAAISASKAVPSAGYRYALRVNPSSGNLHPTEFHFASRGLRGWPDGLYHYRPSSHMAEQRASGDGGWIAGDAPVVFLLTAIAWREAWKYRERAYRYCLLDAGHAWQSLALAAEAAGCEAVASGAFADDEVSRRWGLAEDEWPLTMVAIRGNVPKEERGDEAVRWFGGKPNRLSVETIEYPAIVAMHEASKLVRAGGLPGRVMAEASGFAREAVRVARQRRSALDFVGGDRAMALAVLRAILREAMAPMAADFEPAVALYVYVHRVEGLEPGVYRYRRDGDAFELLRSGDQRVVAAGLSLSQDLAGNSCVTFSMIADLEALTRVHGDRGYRYAFFEAGAIGQRLYLGAEAMGLRGTGIGAFFDERVHEYLGIARGEGFVVYHFAIGYAVDDPRLEA